MLSAIAILVATSNGGKIILGIVHVLRLAAGQKFYPEPANRKHGEVCLELRLQASPLRSINAHPDARQAHVAPTADLRPAPQFLRRACERCGRHTLQPQDYA